MVLVQKGPFFQLFFFGHYRPGTCLLRYSRTKRMPFQAIKTRRSKSRKIDIILKGLTYGFGPKMAIFPPFFLLNIGQENVFYDILERKMPFQAIKRRSSESRIIDIFLTWLTHGFGPKVAIFPTFFFRQYRPGKCLLGYSRTKKCLSRV